MYRAATLFSVGLAPLNQLEYYYYYYYYYYLLFGGHATNMNQNLRSVCFGF